MIVKIADKLAEIEKRIGGDNLKEVGQNLRAMAKDRKEKLLDDDTTGDATPARGILADGISTET